jgi:type VI secretion system protein ImpG
MEQLQPTNRDFSDYFMQELDCLRSQASIFGRDNPGVARELQLSAGKSSDPHVELLLQSFAFMSARLHSRVDSEINEIPDTMLNTLIPSASAPVPSMSIAQMQIQPNGANFVNGYRLEKGRIFYTQSETEKGKTVRCKFSTCYETELLPFTVDSVSWVPVNQIDFLKKGEDVHSVLRVDINNNGACPIHNYSSRTLRFWIGNDFLSACKLYDLLCFSCRSIVIAGDFNGEILRLNGNSISFMGFEDKHSVMVSNAATHQAHRLLQEYFYFAEKYLFFEVNNVPLTCCNNNLSLYFCFDKVPETRSVFNSGTIRLNCVPVINCFEMVTDPIKLDHHHYEYRLLADQELYRYLEVHTILSMEAVGTRQEPKPVVSFFSFDKHNRETGNSYFWISRRQKSMNKDLQGTETYLSFHDTNFNIHKPAEELIYAKALCTNRKLPENMQSGCVLTLEGPGPVELCELVLKPTSYKLPPASGFDSWRLASFLTLNHLSLTSGLTAFKNLLSLYSNTSSVVHNRQIDSITDITCRRIQRRIGKDAWRGFCNGMEINVTIDENIFTGGSILLFGTVIHRFLSLYADVNSFAQLKLFSQQKGLVHSWEPMDGVQELI